MASYVDTFAHAFGLYNFCEQESKRVFSTMIPGWASMQLSPWSLIACRDGAMTLYHFAEAMSGAEKTLEN